MPIFEYRGLKKDGKNTKGIVDAENLRTARVKLKKDGIFVTDIRNKKRAAAASNKKRKSGGSVPVRDLAMMTRQLATLLKAQIPLVDSLSAISEQVENPVLAEAIADIKNMVNEGATLHKSLQKYPKIFGKIFISMCEAGEISGTLDVILLRLAEFTESQDQLRSKISSALLYPVIMLFMSLMLLVGLFIFVIPKMVEVFEAAPELELPWYTVVIIDFSAILTNYWYVIIAFAAVGFFAFRSWKNSPSGSAQWDAIQLKMPLFGPINRMIAVSRFTRTLATLLTGGVPMLQALEIVRNVVDNAVLAEAIENARNNITEGESIAGPLKKSQQFPPIVIHMVAVGEKTGDLENMLSQVSDAYDFQVSTKVEGLTALMSPLAIIVMGLVIGVVVLAIMVPLFEMTDAIG